MYIYCVWFYQLPQSRGQVRTLKKRPGQGAFMNLSLQREGKSQDMERSDWVKEHSQIGHRTVTDKPGHRKKQIEQGHLLPEITQCQTSQDAERNRVSKGHSPSGDCTAMDEWEHRKKKDWARGTHSTHLLKNTNQWTSQDAERNRLSKGNSLIWDHTATDKSGQKKATEWRVRSFWGSKRGGQEGTGRKEPSEGDCKLNDKSGQGKKQESGRQGGKSQDLNINQLARGAHQLRALENIA